MAMTERAAPYVNRLLDDSELQRDLREAMAALRGSYSRAEKRRKPSKLIGDKRFKRNSRRAAASLRDAGKRLRGEPPKSHRGRKIVLTLVAVGVVVVAVKQALKGDQALAAGG